MVCPHGQEEEIEPMPIWYCLFICRFYIL